MSPTPSERNATFQLKRALKAEDECRALQARVAELEDELGSSTTYTLNELQAKVCGLAGERDRLKSELAEIHKQEPVSHRYRFIHPISGEPVWRDSSRTWNGQCVQEVQPLFAAPVPPVREPVAWRWRMNGQWHYGPEPLFKDGFTTQEPLYDKPIPPVREPLSDNTIAALRQAIVQPARQVPTTNYVQPVPDHCDRITWRNRYYHLPLAAALPYGPRPTFGAIGSRDVDVAEAQRAWDKAMAAQPAQVPAWQPIETTPKREEVIVYSEDMRNPSQMLVGMLIDGEWCCAGYRMVNATHWMPLPAAPEVK